MVIVICGGALRLPPSRPLVVEDKKFNRRYDIKTTN
jgi:hypothetical protein